MTTRTALLFTLTHAFLLMTLPRAASAVCVPSPNAPQLTKSEAIVTVDPITGMTQREYELTMSVGNDVSCIDGDMNCVTNAVINVGTGTFNVAGGALCDNDGESMTVPSNNGVSGCERKLTGAGNVSVTHTVTVKPGARYIANWRLNSQFTGSCKDTNEALGWGWSNVCGSTNTIDIPPVIEAALIMGMDMSDSENLFLGPMNTLMVGKSANLTLYADTPPGSSDIVRKWRLTGAGIDVHQEISTGARSVEFEGIVPTQAGPITATLEVSGKIRGYEAPDCDYGPEESWTVTSEPFVINVTTMPCPKDLSSNQLYIPSDNKACDDGETPNPDPEPDPSSKGDDSDSSGCSAAGSASFALMGLFPVFAIAFLATKRRRIGHRCDRR
ncbi:MAG: hypothetical protein LBM75_03085 [Myxococcales bacterium]|nr:hypothetical protein [Myxococcales bacterium]